MNVVTLLKFIATILITNSHFGVLYPTEYQFLATGGTIGNSLFFFVSGYTLYFSNKDSFKKWIVKRFLRIMLSVWIFALVTSIVLNKWNIVDFILPNYWFLRAILVFYLMYYVVIKYFSDKIKIVSILLFTGYLLTFFLDDTDKWVIEITDNPTFLHWYYYFGIMLLGSVVAKNKDIQIQNTLKNTIGLVSFIIIYYGAKYFVFKYTIFEFQFLIPITLFFICYYTFNILLSFKNIPNLINKPIQFISTLTLEIYIVQFIIIKSLYHVIFPLNALFSVILIVVFSYMLNFFATKLMNKIIQK